MWLSDSLKSINKEMSRMEKDKELVERQRKEQLEYRKKVKKKEDKRKQELEFISRINPEGITKLSQSKIWSRTEEEENTLLEMGEQLTGYSPYNETQRAVISFTSRLRNRFIVLTEPLKEVDTYIEKSNYWDKLTRDIPKKDGNGIAIVYAYNPDMQAVIFKFLDKIIITTLSSFENYIKLVKDKVYEPNGKNNS